MQFRTVENIFPGDELFVDYGKNYWDDRETEKVRQLTIESLNRHMDEFEMEMQELRDQNNKLVEEIEHVKTALRQFFGVEPKEWVEMVAGKD